MSLPKSEISEILSAMGDILTRLIDRVEKNIEFQPFERRELLNTLYKQMCGIQIDEILARTDNKHKLQIKRGDTDKNNAYVGQPGEITMDTDAKAFTFTDIHMPAKNMFKRKSSNEHSHKTDLKAEVITLDVCIGITNP